VTYVYVKQVWRRGSKVGMISYHILLCSAYIGAKGLYMAFTMSISIFQTQIRIWLWFGKDNSYPYLSNSATVTDMNQT